MKIAISSTSEDINSNVSEFFGRCPYFIIAEVSAKSGSASGGKNQKIEKAKAIKNENTDQSSGAGISTAQLMAEENVNAVITGNVGPRALDVLKQFNIEIYSGNGIIKEVLQEFINGKLKKLQ
ncbi:NifB/NifX family molybdenum-iron cluster-binding protein [Patescibacteria group bacterium]|nr:NifB/NifX family molybdenum-iron cluster-binding protein [Patescibacteria group bacterium]MBU4512759.1 NifB/NifX family molybdenum-iron cluster-binding protein [Patescibacteria group bacterium]MCG2693098.1 NifB/NifX family molybdenum-iron cluster-binding protein [Candidatus Parcubacteria bacterium]